MTLTELMPQLKELTHEEKLQAVEFLNAELEEEHIKSIFTEKEYPIYTPFGMEDAALKVMQALKGYNEET